MGHDNRGTTSAMDAFLAGIEKRAYRMAVIATRNQDDALDIVQDSMFKLVRTYRERPEQEWAPLFYRILHSTIMDWHRRHKVRNRFRVFFGGRDAEDQDDDDPIETQAAAPGPLPEQQVQQHAAITALDVALQQLPLRQQQIFLLRQWQGLDVAQTAQAVGISEGSVKTHYSRAVHSLRAMLEDHW